jgi:HK97 gp10 family phage protein
MADYGFEVKGIAELQAKLNDLGTKAAERASRKALRAGADIVQVEITERAPVKDTTGGTLPDGALKSDIVAKVKKEQDGVIRAIIGPDKDTAWVAGLVEYGHRGVVGGRSRLLANGKTRGSGTQTHDVPAHSFIRVAWEAVGEEVVNVISTTLAAEIESEAKRKGTT